MEEEVEQEKCECCGEPLSSMIEIENNMCNACIEEMI